MAAGLIAAVVLVAMPFIPATENALIAVVLLAFALGWALLAVLSPGSATNRNGGQPRSPAPRRMDAAETMAPS